MSEVKVSVVIPVYNAGVCLDRMLESVCTQTLREIEIICVDDGSTDNSREIIKDFASRDSRVRLIEQKNLFAGVARNNGFSCAQGDYVVFWDADDFFEEKALEVMHGKISGDGADICLCDAYKYYTESDKSLCSDEFVKYGNIPENLPFSKKDVPDRIFNLGANVPWNKMFRTAFIKENGLEFQNIRQANDTYFVLMAMFLAEKITYVRDRLVHYRCDTKGSITSGKAVIPPCAFEAYSLLKSELEKREDYSEENRRSFMSRAARGMLRVLHMPMSQSDYESVRSFLIERGFEELGLICKAEEYDSRWVYEDIQSILGNTATEHMIYKYNSAKASKDKIKSKSIRLKEKLDKKEKKNVQLSEKLSDSKQKLKETEKELAKVKKERDALERKFTALRKKWYVRLFVKIENILKGKNKNKPSKGKDE